MLNIARLRPLAGLAIVAALASASAVAQKGEDNQDDRDSREIKQVFVIAMENHNWTQPAQVPGDIQAIYQNPDAPFINSLVSGTAVAWITGKAVNISKHTAFAMSYHNVLATQSGNIKHIHPSEPNYIWAEAGDNFGVANDSAPYKEATPNAQN